MTVCIATNMYYPDIGGIPNFYRYLTQNLISQGHKVIVLTVDRSINSIADTQEQSDNYTLIRLRGSFVKYKQAYQSYFRPGGYDAPDWIATALCIRDWLNQHHAQYKIDIIETGDYGGLGTFLIDDSLPPVIVNGHSSITQLKNFNHVSVDDHSELLMQFEKLSFKYSDALFVSTPKNQLDLKNICRRKVMLATMPWVFPSFPTGINMDSKKNIVVGGLQITKGAELMSKAAATIANNIPGWNVHWYGADTHTAPGGERVSCFLAKKFGDGWKRNFIWENEKDHTTIMNEIAGAATVIIPSIWDTFNYSALEAAYLQRPLVLTENTGSSFLFQNDPNVRVVPASPNAIADIFINEKQLHAWKGSINNSTKQKLQELFSPEKIIKERMTLYEQIIATRQLKGNVLSEPMALIKQKQTKTRKFYFTIRKLARNIFKGKSV